MFGLIIFANSTTYAGSVTVAWDPSIDAEVVGYTVYLGTNSGQYTVSFDAGNQTFYLVTTPDVAQTYYFAVQAYTGGGVRSPLSEEVSWQDGGGSTVTVPASPLTITGVTSDKLSPQTTGTTVTFSAAATGGVSPYQFKWWLSADGGATWNIGQDWSTSASFSWTPTAAGNGYRVQIWARNSGNNADAADSSAAAAQVSYAITAPARTMSISLTSNKSAPEPTGSRIAFTANTAGGDASVQYKWWVYDGSTWAAVQDWAWSNKFAWVPQTPNASYWVMVWARFGSTGGDQADASARVAFPITTSFKRNR